MNSVELVRELRVIEKICRDVSEFLDLLSDLKLRSLKDLKEENYKPLLDFIGYTDNEMISELIRIGENNNFEEQTIELEIFKKKYSETFLYYFLKAYLANENKQYKLSKFFYEKALEINPNHSGTHNNLGVLLESEYYKDYQGARRHYEKALEINPKNAVVRNNLAILLQSKYFRKKR